MVNRTTFAFGRKMSHFSRKKKIKGDYPRTRAGDYKHLPAVILNVFLVNILGYVKYQYIKLKKKNKFTMVLYEKSFKMLGIFLLYIIECFVEFKLM